MASSYMSGIGATDSLSIWLYKNRDTRGNTSEPAGRFRVMINVCVVDYCQVFRVGLVSVLQEHPEFQVVGDTGSIQEAVAKMDELQPDIIIMDAFGPDDDGVEAIACLQRMFPQVKILILTASYNEENFIMAIKAGVSGYLLKSLGLSELIDSIRLVASGGAVVYTSMASRLFREPREMDNGNKKVCGNLSQREVEVLQLVAKGSSNKEIAACCFISETTVKAHLRKILEKLNAKNRAQAVVLATVDGLLLQ